MPMEIVSATIDSIMTMEFADLNQLVQSILNGIMLSLHANAKSKANIWFKESASNVVQTKDGLESNVYVKLD